MVMPERVIASTMDPMPSVKYSARNSLHRASESCTRSVTDSGGNSVRQCQNNSVKEEEWLMQKVEHRQSSCDHGTCICILSYGCSTCMHLGDWLVGFLIVKVSIAVDSQWHSTSWACVPKAKPRHCLEALPCEFVLHTTHPFLEGPNPLRMCVVEGGGRGGHRQSPT